MVQVAVKQRLQVAAIRYRQQLQLHYGKGGTERLQHGECISVCVCAARGLKSVLFYCRARLKRQGVERGEGRRAGTSLSLLFCAFFFALLALVPVPTIVALIVQRLAAFSTFAIHAITNITVPSAASVPRHLWRTEGSQRDCNMELDRNFTYKNWCAGGILFAAFLHV